MHIYEKIKNQGDAVLRTTVILGFFMLIMHLPASAEESASNLLKQFNAQYDRAWNTLDAHQLAEQFTNDAIVLPPTSPAGSGKRAVLDFFEPLFKAKWSDHQLEPIAARRVGDDVMVASSRWYASFTDQSGKTTRYHGDVAQTFQRAGGHWKLKLSS